MHSIKTVSLTQQFYILPSYYCKMFVVRMGMNRFVVDLFAMLNNQIKKMNKLPFAHQKKQKILNYQIKLIQQCSDSLFNSSNCNHQRYLQWNLYQTLRSIIQNEQYQIRWMGNDRNSYIYTYFYITITACSKHPTSMVQLKSVLYELAQKYLSQYEQKLLIQFLCLIEYSQEKYLFFRKYAKVQNILLKLFQEIQYRNHQLPYRSPRSSIQDDNTFSKLTTCITSPCKSLEKQQDGKCQQRSGQKINNSLKKSNHKKSKRRFVAMFDVYSKYFKFVNIEYLQENIIKFTISFQRVNDNTTSYICIEKGCFFVVQVGTDLAISSNISKKSCSMIQEEKQYIQQIISNQKTRSKIKNNSIEFNGRKQSNHENQFTPKFLSNKKKCSFADQDFYNELVTNKNVNIEVLEVQDFDEKHQSLEQSRNAILYYKKKIQNLNNINNTIKSIDLDKTNTRQNMPFRYNAPKVKTEHTPFQQYFNYKKNSQKLENNHFSKRYLKNNEKDVSKHPSFIGTNRTALNAFRGALKVNPQNISKTIKQNNTFSKETMLSANNLKRFNKQAKPFFIEKEALPSRQFHSHSPRNKLIETRPPSYYNPFASPLKPRFALRSKENKIKFTYL